MQHKWGRVLTLGFIFLGAIALQSAHADSAEMRPKPTTLWPI